MTLTLRHTVGTGTLLHPTFRAVRIVEKVTCARIEKLGNLAYLYDASGYVIRAVDPKAIIKKED